MEILFDGLISHNEKVAVALSGGSDSVALLHYLKSKEKEVGFSLSAINVEHGIRGKESLNDTAFVKKLCKELNVPLYAYSVDALKKSKEEGLSVEESARLLRYECFYDALNKGLCDKIATAHHKRDNLETVLINLFRGTGIKGVGGIPKTQGKIIRPFLGVSKAEIEKYVKEQGLKYVTDSTNEQNDYSRNYIRNKILPLINGQFPNAENNVYRFSLIAREEDAYLDDLAKGKLDIEENKIKIALPIDKVLFGRAFIIAIRTLGIKKDWQRINVEDAYTLSTKENGKKITLSCGVVAIKEYDKIVVFVDGKEEQKELPFKTGKFTFCEKEYKIEKVKGKGIDLKSGLFIDKDKVPKGAVIRRKEDGDTFTKFGGGTKSLSDYLTDKKVPLRTRKTIPLLAYKKDVLAIFGVAVSEKVKAEETTETLLKLT